MNRAAKAVAVLFALLAIVFFHTAAPAFAEPDESPTATVTAPDNTENLPDNADDVVGMKTTPRIADLHKKILEKIQEYQELATSDNAYKRAKAECMLPKLNHSLEFVTAAIKEGRGDDEVSDPVGFDEARCATGSSLSHPVAFGQAKASDFWNDAIGKVAKAALAGVGTMLETALQLWAKTDLFPQMGGQSSAMMGVRSYTLEIQIILMIVGIVAASIKLAIERQKAILEGATEVAAMMVRTGIAAFLLPSAVLLLHHAGDAFSSWVLYESSGGDVAAALSNITMISQDSVLGPFVVMFISLFTLLGTFVQIVSLVIREAILIIVVALAPIVAAMSATPGGKRSWDSVIAFTLSALAFKPIGSLIYAIAFWQSGASDTPAQVTSMVLLGLAGFMMPSLVRLFAPAASILASNSGASLVVAGAAAGAVGAAGTIAAGAVGVGGKAMSAGGAKIASGAAINPDGVRRQVASASSGGAAAGGGGGFRSGGGGAAAPGGSLTVAPSGGGGGGAPGGVSAPPSQSSMRRAKIGSQMQRAGQAVQRGSRAGKRATAATARGVSTAVHTVNRLASGAIGSYHGHISR